MTSTATRCLRGLGLLTLSATFGCGSSPIDEKMASRFVKSVDVAAATGASIEIAPKDSPDLAGTRLDIPSGALAQNTRITLELQRDPIVTGDAEPAGPVAKWGPPGTAFSKAATLRLPFALPAGFSEQDLIVELLEDNGQRARFERESLSVDAAAGFVSLPVSGFSRYQAGARKRPRPDAGADRLPPPIEDGGAEAAPSDRVPDASPEVSRDRGVFTDASPDVTRDATADRIPEAGRDLPRDISPEIMVATADSKSPDTTPAEAGSDPCGLCQSDELCVVPFDGTCRVFGIHCKKKTASCQAAACTTGCNRDMCGWGADASPPLTCAAPPCPLTPMYPDAVHCYGP